jgi:hypothetical protein
MAASRAAAVCLSAAGATLALTMSPPRSASAPAALRSSGETAGLSRWCGLPRALLQRSLGRARARYNQAR